MTLRELNRGDIFYFDGDRPKNRYIKTNGTITREYGNLIIYLNERDISHIGYEQENTNVIRVYGK